MSDEVRIVNAEALRIGPDDRLIIKISGLLPDADEFDGRDQFVTAVVDELVRIGLKDRAFIITDADDTVEFTVVSPAAQLAQSQQ